MKLSTHPRADQAVIGGFLQKEEYNALCAEQASLRKQITAINKQITDSKGTNTAILEDQRRKLSDRWTEINELLHKNEVSRREVINNRLARLGVDGVRDILLSAKQAIEELQEATGDNWSDEHRLVCSHLRRLAGQQSPLLNYVPRNELEDMQAEYERKLTAAERAAQLAVAHLKAQVRDATSRQGKAAKVLREIYEGRYQEIDPHRVARGITHRIHLTQEDCKKIEESLD